MGDAIQRLRHADRIYEKALELTGEDRRRLLEDACSGEPELRELVERLLAGAEEPLSALFTAGAFDGPLGEGLMALGKDVDDLSQRIEPDEARLPEGSRIGHYEIISLLGSGGMGVVYRARDTRLKREVAIKMLPPQLVESAAAMSRFQREAETLAALGHPGIAAIYSIEETGGEYFLVMELVEGETLARRLEKGRLPLDKGLRIARQIATALEVAHNRGIVHRDLKPDNVMVANDGRVKLLDFGLAMLLPREGEEADRRLTEPGMLAGTAAYMSPEQARGESLDRRTDVWAFGCVLFEILSGVPTFARSTSSDTVAALLEHEPDWTLLPRQLPPDLARLLRRCLEKDTERRLRDIGDARLDIEDATTNLVSTPTHHKGDRPFDAIWRPMLRQRPIRRWILGSTIGLALGFGLARYLADDYEPVASLTRFEISQPEGASLFAEVNSDPRPSVDPLAKRIAFVADGPEGPDQIWLRQRAGSDAAPIPGSAGAEYPFWSEDGSHLGFTGSGAVAIIDNVEIGTSRRLVEMTAWGGAWHGDDILVGSTEGIIRLSPDGGPGRVLIPVDVARGESSHRFPLFLPDGRRFLYTVVSDDLDRAGIWVGSLDSNSGERILPDMINVAYADKHLFFVRREVLVALPFDPISARPSGEPIPLATNVVVARTLRSSAISAAKDLLVYRRLRPFSEALVWFDREGNRIEEFTDAGYLWLRFNRDGTQLAVSELSERSELYLMAIDRPVPQRFVHRDGFLGSPVWSPDGRRLAFAATSPERTHNIYVKDIEGGKRETLFHATQGQANVSSWTQEGLVMSTKGDLWLIRTGSAENHVKRLTETPFVEGQARVSPDGRWLAYMSNELAGPEIFVQAFPEAVGSRRISPAGGMEPVWSAGGHELYYLQPPPDRGSRSTITATLVAVAFDSQRGIARGQPEPLFSFETSAYALTRAWRYAVHPDGRILVNLAKGGSEATLTVVVNWQAEVEALRRRGAS